MKTITRAVYTVLAPAGLFLALVSNAAAGCGDVSQYRGPFQMVSPAVLRGAIPAATAKSAEGNTAPSVAGMWKVQFISEGNASGNPSIPDGAVVDFGYSQLHSDGTEIMNSGGHAPSTQNFCMGVWGKTGYLTYEVNHFALSYDSNSGELENYVNIRENLTLSPSGDSFTGTFTIDIYTTNQSQVAHIAGNIAGTRVTVDTTEF
jgi:hypothetical protein